MTEQVEAAKKSAFGIVANPRIVDRVWIASYIASEYAGVLSRGLFFRSIHDTKEDAERMSRDPQARDFTVTEYVRASKLPAVEEKAAPSGEGVDEQKLREYLWLHHGHDGLYGDDGEMQCGRCKVWDYKRSPIDALMKNFPAKPQPDSSSIPEQTADYLLGRCIPHLDTLAHHGNQEAQRLRAEITDYAKGSR